MRFAYVICELVDGLPSFRHDFVEAETVEEAYDIGHRTVRQPTGEGLNDYAFPVDGPGKPEYERRSDSRGN